MGDPADDELAYLVDRAEDAGSPPGVVRASLRTLLDRSPQLGIATALGIVSRDPRVKPSRALVIDPLDSAFHRWSQRVAAGAALVSAPAVVTVHAEVLDELSDDVEFARDVLALADIHPDLPAPRRDVLLATRDFPRPQR